MKKSLLLAACSAVTLTACMDKNGNNFPNDWQMHSLHGEVKAVKTTVYEPVEKSGEIQKGKILPYAKKQSMEIDRKNDIVFYSRRGRISHAETVDDDGRLSTRSKYSYNRYGQLCEYNSYDAEGKLTVKVKYQYPTQKDLVSEQRTYGPEGTLIEISKAERKENQTSWYSYSVDGELICKQVITTDQKNNMPSSIFEYDDKDVLYYSVVYEYDENNNVIREERSEVVTTYKYMQFDVQNNWTTAYAYMRNNPDVAFIIERNIEYYK